MIDLARVEDCIIAPNQVLRPDRPLDWGWIRPPTHDDLALLLWNRIVKLVVSSLEAETPSEFMMEFQRNAGAFHSSFSVFADIARSRADKELAEAQIDFAADAERYGGERWREAVADSLHLSASLDRIAARVFETISDDELAASKELGRFFGFALLHSWCFMCFLLLASGEHKATKDVREIVRRMLPDTARMAYRAIRGFEISRKVEPEEELTFSTEPDPEIVALEADAESESRRLLAGLERE